MALLVLTLGISTFIYYSIMNATIKAENKQLCLLSQLIADEISYKEFLFGLTSITPDLLKTLTKKYEIDALFLYDTKGILRSSYHNGKFYRTSTFNIAHKQEIYSPTINKVLIGKLETHIHSQNLRNLWYQFFIFVGLIIASFVFMVLMLRQLISRLLHPLQDLSDEVAAYNPGGEVLQVDRERYHNREIFTIAKSIAQMQRNIEITIAERDKEAQMNKIKDATIIRQSRFVEIASIIGNIAHQWRQPLNIIGIAMTDLVIREAKKTITDEYRDKVYGNIRKQVDFMSQTIALFMNFLSKNHSNTFDTIDLSKSAANALQLLDSTIKKSSVTLDLHLQEDLFIESIINEMEQVVLVLINNAIDAIKQHHSDGSHGEISIRTYQNGPNAYLSVWDNGGGIDPTIIDKIFQAYFTTKHMSQGTGLGLFIVKTIVELRHGGTVEAGNVGEGALFMVTLPIMHDLTDAPA